VPVAHWELRGHHRGSAAVALLDSFEQFLFLPVTHGGQAEVVNDQHGELGEALQQPIVDTLCASLDEVVQQCRQAQVLDTEAAAAGRQRDTRAGSLCGSADLAW
jgi:hypothetical protein